MSEPWKNWIPGVLSREQVQELCKEGYLKGIDNWDKKGKKNPIGHSAFDLTLTDEGYIMEKGPLNLSVVVTSTTYVKIN